jgi:hyperosmotically inducible protein
MASKGKLGALLLAGTLALSTTAVADVRPDSLVQSKVEYRLQQKKELRNVQASVSDGVVALNGSVDRYKDKLEAIKQVKKEKVDAVRDNIVVNGETVPDAELAATLAKQLRNDRWSQGHVFNWYTVSVKNGVATISGDVRTPVDKDSALSLAANMPGVKGIVDQVKVLPTSIYDDRLRRQMVRAIYGDNVLSRYGTNPQAPIRIVVDHGHVSLYGAVQSDMDRQIAGIRASQVSGAFSVENHLTTDQSVIR